MSVPGNTADDNAVQKLKPIKDTLARRALTLIGMQTTARFYKRPCVYTIILSRWHLVKTGPYVDLSEAVTMDFIARNTSIPVPKVYCSFMHKKRAWIVMERVRGQVLSAVWPSLSATAQYELLQQLKSMLDELRTLQPPRDMGVANCAGGSLTDSRIAHCESRFGPFKTIKDFHVWLREELSLDSVKDKTDHRDWQEIKEMIVRQDSDWPPPVFTHGDLNPFNIMVDNGKIVSIIDWEFAGWYPCYWEYTSAWYGNRIRPYWQALLDQFLKTYPEDLKMEIVRQKWWGDL